MRVMCVKHSEFIEYSDEDPQIGDELTVIYLVGVFCNGCGGLHGYYTFETYPPDSFYPKEDFSPLSDEEDAESFDVHVEPDMAII